MGSLEKLIEAEREEKQRTEVDSAIDINWEGEWESETENLGKNESRI